jgi:hypothetical protein
MERKLIVVPAAVIVLGLAYSAWAPERERVESATSIDASFRALTAEPQSSRTESAAPRSEDTNIATVDLNTADSDESVRPADLGDNPPPGSLFPRDQNSEGPYDAFVMNLFEGEPRDERWALSMETRVYELLASLGIEFLALAAHCRTAMCRIEAVVDSSRAGSMHYRDFMEAFEPLWSGDSRVAAFIDTHRGDPSGRSSTQVWQGYMVGSDAAQEVRNWVASRARERPSLREGLESRGQAID